MKIRNTAIAGMVLSLALFTAPAFAQSAAGVGAAGAPGASGSGERMTDTSPSRGAPGTQAPASAAPVGSAESKWMAQEGRDAANRADVGTNQTPREQRARSLQTATGREIALARAQGVPTAKAEHQRWLGSVALQKGDQIGAIRHFDRSRSELRQAGYAANEMNTNMTSLRAKETSRTPGAVNTNPTRGETAESSY